MLCNIIKIFVSDLFLVLRNILGCRVNFRAINLVSPFSTLRTKNNGKITIGTKSGIRPGTEISASRGNIIIGNNCFVNRNCMIVSHEKIVLNDNVTIGPGTYIYDHDHDGKGGYVTNPVIIEDNVWIGAGCIILKGVTIHAGSVIAAGTLVTKDVASNTMLFQKRKSIYKER